MAPQRVTVVGITDLGAACFIDKAAAFLVIVGVQMFGNNAWHKGSHLGIPCILAIGGFELVVICLSNLHIVVGEGGTGTLVYRNKAVFGFGGAIQHI